MKRLCLILASLLLGLAVGQRVDAQNRLKQKEFISAKRKLGSYLFCPNSVASFARF